MGLSNQAFISKKSDDEILRNRIEKNFILKKSKIIVNLILSAFGIGNSLKGWFIKT